jgi:HEAT repeat protein
LKPQADASFWKQTTNVDVSAKTLLTVIPPDPERLGNLVDDLGQKILSEHDQVAADARKALASIQDERVLPWLLKSLELKTYGAKFYALTSLANYEAPAAVEALKTALNLKGGDMPNCCTTAPLAESSARNLRVAAVHSLAKNRNSGARKFLLEQRRDPHDEVRLTVVHMLGREKSEESTAILKEMTADTNQLVRSEAERYLKERDAVRH